MSLTTIRTELTSQVAAITTMPPIKDEDENYKPNSTKDYPFARVTLMPSESKQQDLNSGKQMLKGLLRIDLFGSRSLNTTAAIRAVADDIVEAMKPATQTVLSDCSLTIEGSWVESTRYEATVANVPVFVRWNSMAL